MKSLKTKALKCLHTILFHRACSAQLNLRHRCAELNFVPVILRDGDTAPSVGRGRWRRLQESIGRRLQTDRVHLAAQPGRLARGPD